MLCSIQYSDQIGICRAGGDWRAEQDVGGVERMERMLDRMWRGRDDTHASLLWLLWIVLGLSVGKRVVQRRSC